MKKLWLTVLLLLIYFQVTEAIFLPGKLESPTIEQKTIENRLFNIFVSEGVDTLMSKILVAQASHESGKFTNPLTIKHNNVFSIMHTSKRKTLSLGGWGWAEGRKGYCVYSSIDSAARDMLLYMEFRKIPSNFKSISSYSRFLKKKNYYEGYKNLSKEANIKLYASAMYKHYKQIWLKPSKL